MMIKKEKLNSAVSYFLHATGSNDSEYNSSNLQDIFVPKDLFVCMELNSQEFMVE